MYTVVIGRRWEWPLVAAPELYAQKFNLVESGLYTFCNTGNWQNQHYWCQTLDKHCSSLDYVLWRRNSAE